MAVTVYVEGWDQQPTRMVRCYLAEKMPAIDEEDLHGQGFEQDEDGQYFEWSEEYCDPYPRFQASDATWIEIAKALGYQGRELKARLSAQEVADPLRRCLRVTNNDKRMKGLAKAGMEAGNFVDLASSESYMRSRIGELVRVMLFAQRRSLGLYWE